MYANSAGFNRISVYFLVTLAKTASLQISTCGIACFCGAATRLGWKLLLHAQKYHRSAPTFQGPDMFKNLLPLEKQRKQVPEDSSLNANSCKACCVSFKIYFFGVQEEIKKSNCGWEACSRLLEQLSLLNTILHYPGGDLCIFFDLLIRPSFFVLFYILQREFKS